MVGELERLREALRGQVPTESAKGIAEAFLISFEKLDTGTLYILVYVFFLVGIPRYTLGIG